MKFETADRGLFSRKRQESVRTVPANSLIFPCLSGNAFPAPNPEFDAKKENPNAG